jgi:transcriptional regulator with XRE-family HTH domain
MTSRQLAARLGVSEPAVRSAERAEMDGSISLATLRRARSGHLEIDAGEIRWARHRVFSQNLSRLWKAPADAKPLAAPTRGCTASAHTSQPGIRPATAGRSRI